jgi:hypothetical protein
VAGTRSAGAYRLATLSSHSALDGLADVEADLLARLDLLAAAEDGSSDFLVLLGLLNARRVKAAASAEERLEFLREDPANAVERWGVDAADFALFHQLWYRMRVPFGAVPLYWWYLLTLALRDPARGTADAVEQFAAAAEQPGVDVLDTGVLVEAIVHDVPVAVVSEPAADGLPTYRMPGLAEIAGGSEPELADIAARTRERWTGLSPEERTLTLTRLQQRFEALEQMRFYCGGEVRENREIVAVLGSCRNAPPADWSYEQLAFATLAYCWERAGFIVQEFNQALLTLPLVATFMSRRLAEYSEITGRDYTGTPDLIDAASELGRLRAELEETHLRCIQFDGSNWERREFVVPKAMREDFLQIPDSLADLMASRLGVEIADRSGSGAAWDAYVEAVLGEGHTPTQLICALVDWAANDDLLPIDAAIFTVPHGIKLESPWELEIDDVFCYTAFRDGFDPRDHGMPLDLTGMRNAIGQRMRYNVVKKAQNYALVKRFKPQSFNLPDIAVAEDANHAGHRAGGIRLSMRLPTTISYRGDEWKGIADVRCNRGGYHPKNRFRPSDVILGSRYTAWEKGIADATFARDLLFDRRFCVKLTEPTGAQIPA